jgi:hypothetical protein
MRYACVWKPLNETYLLQHSTVANHLNPGRELRRILEKQKQRENCEGEVRDIIWGGDLIIRRFPESELSSF